MYITNLGNKMLMYYFAIIYLLRVNDLCIDGNMFH